jgi:hypothetical protein
LSVNIRIEQTGFEDSVLRAPAVPAIRGLNVVQKLSAILIGGHKLSGGGGI